jgi:hypothetical protein
MMKVLSCCEIQTIEIVRALEPLGTDVAKESKAKVLEAARYCFAEERECEEEHANSDVNILRLSEPVQSGAKESLKSLPVKVTFGRVYT